MPTHDTRLLGAEITFDKTQLGHDPGAVAALAAPKSQPLWRFALVGLGPLSAMGVFALLVALFQRLA